MYLRTPPVLLEVLMGCTSSHQSSFEVISLFYGFSPYVLIVSVISLYNGDTEKPAIALPGHRSARRCFSRRCGFGSFRYGGNVSRIRPLFSETLHHFSSGNFQAEGRFEDVPVAVSPPAASPTLSSRKGNASLFAQAPRYTYAIVNPSDTTFPRLECPKPNLDRYAYLGLSESSITAQLPKYFFALDLHQCVDLLPRLIGSIVETIRFLGP
jgi:hypothetical protein